MMLRATACGVPRRQRILPAFQVEHLLCQLRVARYKVTSDMRTFDACSQFETDALLARCDTGVGVGVQLCRAAPLHADDVQFG